MRIPSNQWLLCYAVCLFGAACNAQQPSPEAISFEIHSSSEKSKDASSPVGYWVKEDSYPVFSGQQSNIEVAEELNRTVSELISRYRCSGGGDESFKMEVETLEAGLVSLSYVAMWHCASMASPASAEGAINRTLPGLEELKLESQFADKGHHTKMKEDVQQRYTTEVAQTEEAEDCPPTPQWDYFTVSRESLEFHFNTSEPSRAHCAATIRLSRKQLQGSLTSDSPL